MEVFNLPSKFENVEFDCIAEDTLYRFRLHVFRDMMYASIYADNEPIVLGQRCVQNFMDNSLPDLFPKKGTSGSRSTERISVVGRLQQRNQTRILY